MAKRTDFDVTPPPEPPPGVTLTLMRLHQVVKTTGVGKSRLYELVAKGDFPPPVRLGPGSVAWVDTEVQTWIRNLMASRLGAGGGAKQEPA